MFKGRDNMGKKPLIVVFLAISMCAAKDRSSQRPPCATTYSVITVDSLGNTDAKLSNPKILKWASKDLEKKYPDICYEDYGDPTTEPNPVKAFFVITVTPSTYHGTRIVTTSSTTPTSGSVIDSAPGSPTYGQQVGTYEGKQTSTSSTAVPYSFDYGRFMLTIETLGSDGNPVVRRRFQQDGIYPTMAGIPLGGRGHHPGKALIEDAVKWIHAGGLDNPLPETR